MAVEKMYLVNMISDLNNLDSFLEDVIHIGDIEPVDAFNQVTNRTFNITASAENVRITEDINKLSGFDKDDNGYRNKLKEIKESLDLKDSSDGKVLDKESVDDFYNDLQSLLAKKAELEEKSEKLKIYKENIDKLKEFNIDIEKIQNLKYFDYRYGGVSEDGRFILKNNYENIPSLIIHLDENVDNASIKALEEIYALDNRTYELSESTKEILKNERNNTRNVSLRLDQDYHEKIQEKSKETYQNIMHEAEDRSSSINVDYQKRINNMDSIYKKYKDEVVDKIVNYLVDSDMEVGGL